MRVTYLFALQSWAVMWGERIIGIGSHNQYLFNSQRELLETLEKCGLSLYNNKVVKKVY